MSTPAPTPPDDDLSVPPEILTKFPWLDPNKPVPIPPQAEHLQKIQAENDTLRGLLGNSALPCQYCGLPAAEQAKCPYGFPGCARADDQMLSKHFADGYFASEYAKENLKLKAEVHKYRAALRDVAERSYDAYMEHELLPDLQNDARKTLAAGDLEILYGNNVVRDLETARLWFLAHSEGSVLGIKEQGDETFQQELFMYTDATLFFNMLS